MRFHDELNPKLWDEFELKEEVKDKLEEITEAFIEYLDIPAESILDVQITGSSANYNYTEHSDLDLHLIVDYEKVHQECPIVEGYLWSMKAAFNKEHDISIYGVPVEVYAEDSRQSAVSNGVYSLLNDEWIKKPEKIQSTTNDAAVLAKYNEIKDIVDKLNDSEEAQDILDKVYEMRKAGLAEAGEFSTENLAFKMLRNEGVMNKLRQLKKEKVDKQLSLESYNKSQETVMDLLIEGGHLLGVDTSFTEEFEKRFDRIRTIKSDKVKIKRAKDLLLDLVGYLVDEKYDEYCKKVWNFMDKKLQEKIDKQLTLESFETLDRYKLINKDDYNKSVKAIDDIINSRQSISKEEYGQLLKAITRTEKEAESGSFTINIEMVRDKAKMQKSKILKLYKNSKNESYVKKVTKDEWNRTHSDYKTIINGKKYMMYIDPEKHKTVLGPVEIINNTDEPIKESQELKVGDIVKCNNVVWVKINSIHGNKANVSPIHKEDIDSGKFKKEEIVALNSLRKSNESINENIDKQLSLDYTKYDRIFEYADKEGKSARWVQSELLNNLFADNEKINNPRLRAALERIDAEVAKHENNYRKNVNYIGYELANLKYEEQKKNESLNEDFEEDDYEDSSEMHKERYVTYFETPEGRQKYTIYYVYTDSTDDSYNELCDKRDNQLGMYSSYNELKDALKERADKIAQKQGWTVKSIENLGEDDEYYRERNKSESIKEAYEWKGPIARVTFDNGEVMETAINGSDEEIKSYYLGRRFNLGTEEDDMHKAVKVEVIRESKSIKELNKEIEELLKD